MDWSQDIISGLPPPSELEPPTLRERIVAEISDHLQCAYQREIHLTQNEKQALSNIYKKFGNPAALARKLWFDEMKGRLMLQKITLGLITALCLTVGFQFYFVNRQMDLQATANQKFYQEQQTQLINSMNELKSSQPKHEPLIVRLKGVPEDPKNPPLFDVYLVLGTQTFHKIIPLGTEYNFGFINSPSVNLTVNSPWGDTITEQFLSGPGQSQLFEYDCPKAKHPVKKINFKFGSSIQDCLMLSDEEYKKAANKDLYNADYKHAFVIAYSIDESNISALKNGKTTWSLSTERSFPKLNVTNSDELISESLPAGTKLTLLYCNTALVPKTVHKNVTGNNYNGLESYLLDGYFDCFNVGHVSENFLIINEFSTFGSIGSEILSRVEKLKRNYYVDGSSMNDKQSKDFKSHFVKLQTYEVTEEENQTFVLEAPIEFQQRVKEQVEAQRKVGVDETKQ